MSDFYVHVVCRIEKPKNPHLIDFVSSHAWTQPIYQCSDVRLYKPCMCFLQAVAEAQLLGRGIQSKLRDAESLP